MISPEAIRKTNQRPDSGLRGIADPIVHAVAIAALQCLAEITGEDNAATRTWGEWRSTGETDPVVNPFAVPWACRRGWRLPSEKCAGFSE